MNQPEAAECLYAKIEGRVQGVGFRYFVLNHARDLNLVGWVRNTHQGQVEVLAEGKRSQLEELLLRLKQGPPSSYVLEVDYNYLPVTGRFLTFEVVSSV